MLLLFWFLKKRDWRGLILFFNGLNSLGPAGLKLPVLCTFTHVIPLLCVCVCVHVAWLISPMAPERKQEQEPNGTILRTTSRLTTSSPFQRGRGDTAGTSQCLLAWSRRKTKWLPVKCSWSCWRSCFVSNPCGYEGRRDKCKIWATHASVEMMLLVEEERNFLPVRCVHAQGLPCCLLWAKAVPAPRKPEQFLSQRLQASLCSQRATSSPSLAAGEPALPWVKGKGLKNNMWNAASPWGQACPAEKLLLVWMSSHFLRHLPDAF